MDISTRGFDRSNAPSVQENNHDFEKNARDRTFAGFHVSYSNEMTVTPSMPTYEKRIFSEIEALQKGKVPDQLAALWSPLDTLQPLLDALKSPLDADALQPPPDVSQPPLDRFQPLQDGFQPPPDVFQLPQDGFQPPLNALQLPSDVFQPSQDGFQPPQDGFQPPQDGFQPPQDGFQPPQDGFQLPQDGFQLPQEGFQPPQDGFQPPPDVFQPLLDALWPPQYSELESKEEFKTPFSWAECVKKLRSTAPEKEYFELISENQKDTVVNLKDEWFNLVAKANDYPLHSEDSVAAWVKALEFANWSALCGYNFKFNSCIALIRLDRFQDALKVVSECLESSVDLEFRNHALMQVAFCYLKLNNPEMAIKSYMATDKKTFTPHTLRRIKALMHMLKAIKADVADELAWFTSLRPERIDDIKKTEQRKQVGIASFSTENHERSEIFIDGKTYNEVVASLETIKQKAVSSYDGTEQQKQRWKDLLKTAACYGVLDYRLNKYVAAAYIQLKKYDLAGQWLQKEIFAAENRQDESYKKEIYKQYGLLYYKSREFECSLRCYKYSIDPFQYVDSEDMEAISDMMARSVQSKEMQDWFSQLESFNVNALDAASDPSRSEYSAVSVRRSAPLRYVELVDDNLLVTIDNIANHWASIEYQAKQFRRGSQQSFSIWAEGLNFAKWSAQFGYRSEINIAKAELRLGQLQHAMEITRRCLKKGKGDFKFISHAYETLAFIEHLCKNHEACIHGYMNTGNRNFSEKTNNMIYHSMVYLSQEHVSKKENYYTEIQWYKNLPVVSIGDLEMIRRAPTLTDEEFYLARGKWVAKKKQRLNFAKDSKKWRACWSNALLFAAEHVVLDYRFNAHVGHALIQLGLWDDAEHWLLKQLAGFEMTYDINHKNTIYRKLGFLYYNKEDYTKSIQYYMCGIDLSKGVAHEDLYTVEIVIYNLQAKNTCTQEILNWWYYLKHARVTFKP